MTNNAHMSPQTPNILHKIVFLIVSLAMALASVCAYSQIRIDWQQCYGSMGNDRATRMVKKPNGYWIAGRVTEQSGMVTIPVLNRSWVIGIDETGVLDNEFSLGPYARIDEDLFVGINQGSIYAIGHPQNELGKEQLGIKKLDANIGVVWETMVGCANEALANSVYGASTPDGGVIASTTIRWAGGDITNHYGLDDVWVVKIDSLGHLEWETNLGTENWEWPQCLINVSSGGYYVAMVGNPGYVGSIPVCQVPSTDASDVLFAKLNNAGQSLWFHCFGGSKLDIVDHVIELEDGFLLVCDTQSDDRDAEGAGYHLGYSETSQTPDTWLVRTDFDGNIVWSRCYGGSGSDFPIKAFQNEDGGFTVFGNTNSNDGDVQSAQNLQIPEDYHHHSRLWVFRTDVDGNLLWERVIGTKYSDIILNDVMMLSDTVYTILATAEMPEEGYEGDFSCTNWDNRLCGYESYWALQITDIFDYNSVEEGMVEATSVSIYPNPTRGLLSVTGKGLKQLYLYDLLGQKVATVPSYNGINAMVDTSGFAAGIYLARVYVGNGVCVKRVVVTK